MNSLEKFYKTNHKRSSYWVTSHAPGYVLKCVSYLHERSKEASSLETDLFIRNRQIEFKSREIEKLNKDINFWKIISLMLGLTLILVLVV